MPGVHGLAGAAQRVLRRGVRAVWLSAPAPSTKDAVSVKKSKDAKDSAKTPKEPAKKARTTGEDRSAASGKDAAGHADAHSQPAQTAAARPAGSKGTSPKTTAKAAAKPPAKAAKNAAAAKTAPAAKAAAAKKTAPKTAGRTAAKTTSNTPSRAPAKETPGSAGPAHDAASEVVSAPSPQPQTQAVGTGPAVRPGEEPWTQAQLDAVRAELLDERARLQEEMDAIQESIDDVLRDSMGGAGDDPADSGSKAYGREQELTLLAATKESIFQTQRALDRIDGGTFGTCESCGEPIGKRRLQAFPRATLCVKCKQAQERR